MNPAHFYESNFGCLDSETEREVQEAVRDFGDECVVHCMREAFRAGARRWVYVKAVLERHWAEGCPQAYSWENEQIDWLRRRYENGKGGNPMTMHRS